MPSGNLSDISSGTPALLAPPPDAPQPQAADPNSPPPLLARPEAPPNSGNLDDVTTNRDTVAATASNHLAQYEEGNPAYNENDAAMLNGIQKAQADEQSAYEDEYQQALQNGSTARRAIKSTWNAGVGLAKDLYKWAGDTYFGADTIHDALANPSKLLPTPQEIPQDQKDQIDELEKAGMPREQAVARVAERFAGMPLAEAAQSATAIAAVKAPGVLYNLAAGAEGLISSPLEEVPGPWQDEVRKANAAERARADVLTHYGAVAANDISKATGISHDTATGMVFENAPYFLLGPMGMGGDAEAVANAVNNSKNALGNVLGVSKYLAAQAAPVAVGAAKAATIDYGLSKLGLSGGLDQLLAAVGGFGSKFGNNKDIVNSITQWAWDTPLKDIIEDGAARATKPLGMQANEHIASILQKKAGTIQEALDADLADMSPKDARRAKDLASDGSFKHPEEDLSPDAQSARSKMQQIQDLQQKSDALLKRNDLQKVYDDAVQVLGGSVIHTAKGAAIGAGFSGANAPTGQTDQAVATGMSIGGILGGAMAPFESVKGMRQAQITKNAAELKDMALRAGSVVGDISGANPLVQRMIYSTGGIMSKLGLKVNVYPEAELARVGGTGTNDPGLGFVDAQGNMHLNGDFLNEGAINHEFPHVMENFQDLFGQMLKKTDPEGWDNFVKQYGDALSYTGRSRFNSQKEWNAEVGKQVLNNTPIELFYGGERGLDVMSRMWQGLLGEGKTKFINGFAAPYTRADILAMKARFFKAGELAKMTNGTIPRDVVPPEKSFTDFTDDQAAKFHRAVEFNQQQGMSPDAAFKDVANNMEWMPKPKPGQTREDALDEAWEHYYAKVQEQNAQREPQEQDFNTKEQKPAWYEPTTFKEDARMRSLLPPNQRPPLEPYVPELKPFKTTYGWMKPDGTYLKNESGNIHANTISKELSGDQSFYNWREHVRDVGGDDTIKNHPYMGAMEWAYRKGWEKGYVRLLNSGKTLYGNISKDFVITPEMKDHLINQAEKTGADRVMIDRDQGRPEKLWDNPAYNRPTPPPSAYFSGQGMEIPGRIGAGQPAAGRSLTYTDHMERSGRGKKRVADMTPEEIQAELAAREAWNKRGNEFQWIGLRLRTRSLEG